MEESTKPAPPVNADSFRKTGFRLVVAFIGIAISALLTTIYVAELANSCVSRPNDIQWILNLHEYQDADCPAPEGGIEQQIVVNHSAVPTSETTSK